jgi:hypothetical protein
LPPNDPVGQAHRFFTRWLPVGLILVTVAYYAALLHQYAMDVPFADDIFDVVKVLSDVVGAEDYRSALEVLYAQHNDHRTLSSRLVYLALYLTGGEIDFRLLIFLANLALLALLLLLYRAARGHPEAPLVLLPAALILFQLRYYGIMLWSMAAFAYFYVFLYGFLSLRCLRRPTVPRFALAAVLAVLATFTLASGQLVWLLGLLALLHHSLAGKSLPFRYVLAWLLLAAITIALWRTGLATPNTPGALLERVFTSPGYYLLYALALTGNAVSETSVALAAGAGAAMWMVLFIVTLRARTAADPWPVLCCWYIVLTILAMTLGRAPYSTVEYALSSRYSFPSVLLLATLWVVVAVQVPIRNIGVLAAAVLLSAAYWAGSRQLYVEPLQAHLERRVDNYNRGKYWSWPRPMKETNAIVARAVDQGIYSPPDRPLPLPDLVQRQKDQD